MLMSLIFSDHTFRGSNAKMSVLSLKTIRWTIVIFWSSFIIVITAALSVPFAMMRRVGRDQNLSKRSAASQHVLCHMRLCWTEMLPVPTVDQTNLDSQLLTTRTNKCVLGQLTMLWYGSRIRRTNRKRDAWLWWAVSIFVSSQKSSPRSKIKEIRFRTPVHNIC